MSMKNLTTSAPRAVIYARISSDRDGEGEGVARQIEACAERAGREGWTLVCEPLRDDSISAWRSGVTRPAYQRLLRMVRERQVDVVLVWHMSRLWRGRVERATGIDVFKDAGVRLAVVQGSEIDFSTAMGRGMAGMLGEVDTMESDLKSERILAQKEKAAEHQAAPNPGPYLLPVRRGRRAGWGAKSGRDGAGLPSGARQRLPGSRRGPRGVRSPRRVELDSLGAHGRARVSRD